MGSNWSSSSTTQVYNEQNEVIRKADLVLLGVCFWECSNTSWFELSVLRGERQFKRPMLVYWLAKYSTIVFAFVVNIPSFQQVPVPLNCAALGVFTQLMARIGMAGCSALLMHRAMALWRCDRRVVIPLAILHAGQWGLYISNLFVIKEEWVTPPGGAKASCQIVAVVWHRLQLQFVYTMFFDLTVLVVATTALLQFGPSRSTLWKILFVDGIGYFLIVFVCYLTCTIIAFLDDSVALALMFSDSATIIARIAACRTFLRLGTYTFDAPSSLSILSTGLNFRVGTAAAASDSTLSARLESFMDKKKANIPEPLSKTTTDVEKQLPPDLKLPDMKPH